MAVAMTKSASPSVSWRRRHSAHRGTRQAKPVSFEWMDHIPDGVLVSLHQVATTGTRFPPARPAASSPAGSDGWDDDGEYPDAVLPAEQATRSGRAPIAGITGMRGRALIALAVARVGVVVACVHVVVAMNYQCRVGQRSPSSEWDDELSPGRQVGPARGCDHMAGKRAGGVMVVLITFGRP